LLALLEEALVVGVQGQRLKLPVVEKPANQSLLRKNL
jgi:hypothetical protein